MVLPFWLPIHVVLVNWVDTDNAVRTRPFLQPAPALPKRARILQSTTATPHAFSLGGLKNWNIGFEKSKLTFLISHKQQAWLALHHDTKTMLCVCFYHMNHPIKYCTYFKRSFTLTRFTCYHYILSSISTLNVLCFT